MATSNATALATIQADIATATGEINTFYTQQITHAANPPPVDNDANDDGVPDAPTPTATESIATQLATIRTQRTTDRTTVREAFSGEITRRQLSDTNTLPETATQLTTPPTSGGTSGETTTEGEGTSGGGTIAYGEQAPPANGTPPATPPTVSISLDSRISREKSPQQTGEEEGYQEYFHDIAQDDNRWIPVRVFAAMCEAACGTANMTPDVARAISSMPSEISAAVREEQLKTFDRAQEATGIERFAFNTAGYVFLPATDIGSNLSLQVWKAGHILALPGVAQTAIATTMTVDSAMDAHEKYLNDELSTADVVFLTIDGLFVVTSLRTSVGVAPVNGTAVRVGSQVGAGRPVNVMVGATDLTPGLLQQSGNSCGLNCVGNVLDELVPSRNGTNLILESFPKDLTAIQVLAANPRGLNSHQIGQLLQSNGVYSVPTYAPQGVLSTRDLRGALAKGPVILHVEGGHWVVVRRFDKITGSVYDPAVGNYKQPLDYLSTRSGQQGMFIRTIRPD